MRHANNIGLYGFGAQSVIAEVNSDALTDKVINQERRSHGCRGNKLDAPIMIACALPPPLSSLVFPPVRAKGPAEAAARGLAAGQRGRRGARVALQRGATRSSRTPPASPRARSRSTPARAPLHLADTPRRWPPHRVAARAAEAPAERRLGEPARRAARHPSAGRPAWWWLAVTLPAPNSVLGLTDPVSR